MLPSYGFVPRQRHRYRRGGRAVAAVIAMARHSLPELRSLAHEFWPAADRAAWEHALRPGDLFDDAPGLAAHWRPATVRLVQDAYGHWLGFLSIVGRLEGHVRPAGRIVPELLRAYIDMLRGHCRGTTVLLRVQSLLEAARVMFPDHNWAWLRRVVVRLRAGINDRKPKLHRIRSSRELSRLGRELMAEAEAMAAKRPLRAAVHFRDGLIIAFLAARPIRASSFCALRVGYNIDKRCEDWWLSLEGSETKTAAPYEAPLPTEFAPALDRYLAEHRPRLLGGRDDDHLWITKQGAPMRINAVRMRVMRLTAARFGVGITTHLFRDCAATSVAIEDPAHVQAAAALLGHRSLATMTKHYNQATGLEATRSYQATVLKLRRFTATALRDRA